MVEEEERYFLSHEFWIKKMDVTRKKRKRRRRGEAEEEDNIDVWFESLRDLERWKNRDRSERGRERNLFFEYLIDKC